MGFGGKLTYLIYFFLPGMLTRMKAMQIGVKEKKNTTFECALLVGNSKLPVAFPECLV